MPRPRIVFLVSEAEEDADSRGILRLAASVAALARASVLVLEAVRAGASSPKAGLWTDAESPLPAPGPLPVRAMAAGGPPVPAAVLWAALAGEPTVDRVRYCRGQPEAALRVAGLADAVVRVGGRRRDASLEGFCAELAARRQALGARTPRLLYLDPDGKVEGEGGGEAIRPYDAVLRAAEDGLSGLEGALAAPWAG